MLLSFNQLKPEEEAEDSVYMCLFHVLLVMINSKQGSPASGFTLCASL